jgi:DNA transposition AAA+ family ATPase
MTSYIRALFTALLLSCTSLLCYANSSAQARDNAPKHNSPSNESNAEQRISVKQIPSIPVEEIVISARQSFSSLRTQIDIAEKSLYNTYNNLNDLDEYDVECRKTDWAGTFIREQMCWPAFLTEMSARNVQDWRRDLDILIPVDHMILLYGDKMDVLRANVRRIAGEYPEAAIALLEVGKLQAAIKRKHDMCMAQKPVLFVFRLCR